MICFRSPSPRLKAMLVCLILLALPVGIRLRGERNQEIPAPDSVGTLRYHPASLLTRHNDEKEKKTSVVLRVRTAKGVRETALEDYVFLCVAAEMPASYPEEALCAQAVCARTLAAYKIAHGADHGDGTVLCDDSGHCQAMTDDDSLRERWGERYDFYRDKISRCVEKTAGEILTYDGEPIEIFYHASSNGATEAAAEVFASGQSYLASVPSPEEVEESSFSFTYDEFRERIRKRFSLQVDEEDVRAMSVSERTASGRVAAVSLAGQCLDGVAFRHALGLKSTDFSWTIENNGLTFNCRGYGHGVGMSQKGARTMAADGADYREILAHYYKGTQITSAFHWPIA